MCLKWGSPFSSPSSLGPEGKEHSADCPACESTYARDFPRPRIPSYLKTMIPRDGKWEVEPRQFIIFWNIPSNKSYLYLTRWSRGEMSNAGKEDRTHSPLYWGVFHFSGRAPNVVRISFAQKRELLLFVSPAPKALGVFVSLFCKQRKSIKESV